MAEPVGLGRETIAAGVPATTPRGVHPWVAEQERRVRFGVFGGRGAEWPWPRLRAWAQTAERLGFDSLWLGDHPMGGADCWTTLAALAVHTERVRLGPLASCVYYRSAGLLASQATDVDRLSGGRLVLGLGAGDIPHEFAQLGLAYPPFPERAAALAETVALVRGLWEGAPVTLQGAHVRAVDARMATRPVQAPHVPLLIAGGGERITLRQVAQHADMCNFGPNGATGSAWGLPEVRRKLAALDAHCAAVGRPPEAVLRSHIAWIVIAEDEAAVEAKLAARPSRADMVEAPREPGLPRRLTAYYRAPSIEHVANITVAGTPPQFVAYFRALIDAGMRYFVVGPDDLPASLRLLAEEVVPHLAVPA